jgi:hypothetical protein
MRHLPALANGAIAKRVRRVAKAFAAGAMHRVRVGMRDLVIQAAVTLGRVEKVLAPARIRAQRSRVWAMRRFVHNAKLWKARKWH